jgi:hypothetical protein
MAPYVISYIYLLAAHVASLRCWQLVVLSSYFIYSGTASHMYTNIVELPAMGGNDSKLDYFLNVQASQ